MSSYWIAWIGTIGTIWVLFDIAEKVASQDLKLRVRNWLQNDLYQEEKFGNWADYFSQIFDNVFGKKHISWHCFGRSCVSSFIAVIILTFFWIALRPHHFLSNIISFGIEFPEAHFASAIFFNLFPDYISLLETRFIISQMKGIKKVWRKILFLFIDIGLTTSIFVICLLVFFVFSFADISNPVEVKKVYDKVVKLILAGLFLNSPSGEPKSTMGVFFYSTFFTSVWVWLYILSGMAVRALNTTFKGVNVIKSWLDIDNQPIRVLGVLAIVGITVLFVVASPFVILR